MKQLMQFILRALIFTAVWAVISATAYYWFVGHDVQHDTKNARIILGIMKELFPIAIVVWASIDVMAPKLVPKLKPQRRYMAGITALILAGGFIASQVFILAVI